VSRDKGITGEGQVGETFRRVSVFLPGSTSTYSFLPRATICEVLAKMRNSRDSAEPLPGRGSKEHDQGSALVRR
jgi:hypothetical protein